MNIYDMSTLITTVNGTGSSTSNELFIKELHSRGIEVLGKNIFPSNIAGLPTSFSFRCNNHSFLSLASSYQIYIGLSKEKLAEDVKLLDTNAVIILNADLKSDDIFGDFSSVCSFSFRSIVKDLGESLRERKLLSNMVYLGGLAALFGFESNFLNQRIEKRFSKKDLQLKNLKAFSEGWNIVKKFLELTAQDHLLLPNQENYKKNTKEQPLPKSVLIDGNSLGALGSLHGGASFLSWYPITPSTSFAESFIHWNNQLKLQAQTIQAEDELAAVGMTLGSNWSGSPALTCTSGPGISLMSETVGLSYFAEIPLVIWDVQRVGPSTGLPTRTQQSDLKFAFQNSHGDGEHIVFLPSSPLECYSHGSQAINISQKYKTPVFVLSDLDIGMNLWPVSSNELNELSDKPHFIPVELDFDSDFKAYGDPNNSGISKTSLPGIGPAYFTRGSGHNENAMYSERPDDYLNKMRKLKKKHLSALVDIPQPEVKMNLKAQVGIISFGSSTQILSELEHLFKLQHTLVSTLIIKALPLHVSTLDSFLKNHPTAVVIEQNADSQMFQIIKEKCHNTENMVSLASSNGLPISAQEIFSQLEQII